MKRITILVLAIASVVLCASCSKEERFKKYFNLSDGIWANCYIVSKAGDYRFVVSPVTENPNLGKAEVLWESFGTDKETHPGDIVKNVFLDGFYVYFSTPSTLHNGNAVIAVRDTDGIILWSWHIWVCKDYDPEKTAQRYRNSRYEFMDRNLGATKATGGTPESIGLFYQWGRKDPFPGAGSFSEDAQTAETTTNFITSIDPAPSVEVAIQRPTAFFHGKIGVYDWLETPDDELWHTDRYDPCPQGWHLPKGGKLADGGYYAEAFGANGPFRDESLIDENFHAAHFTKDGSITLTDGDDVWYPLCGDGFSHRFAPENVNLMCSLWTSDTSSSNGYCFRIYNSGTIEPASTAGRECAYPIRCTREILNP